MRPREIGFSRGEPPHTLTLRRVAKGRQQQKGIGLTRAGQNIRDFCELWGSKRMRSSM